MVKFKKRKHILCTIKNMKLNNTNSNDNINRLKINIIKR